MNDAPAFDRRLTPARPDLAAAFLRGRVEAAAFAEGRPMRVRVALADLRPAPDLAASIDTQALYGETALLYDAASGFGWAQLARDSYVGYLPIDALEAPAGEPTHRVAAPQTFVYPRPDMKRPVLAALTLGARLCVADEAQGYARLADGGFVYAAHLAPLDAPAPDFVAVAETLLGAPYLWGGKSARGVDCSGLVQTALDAAGVGAPRDTDMQENALGTPLADGEALRRGDLVFWRGHVGIMRDERLLLHANARHMLVASEPFAEARARIAAGGLDVSSIRRMFARRGGGEA
ncbi:C40 family peptidase [Methylocella sp.]|uniref:C40 family peptidase n=1 Tax=Methylocella sp. TaxID=1978226 RepID=UPI003783E9AD